MYTFTETEVGMMLVVFGYALWYTWHKAAEKAYETGYGDACYDVAKGNITVSLSPPDEMDR